MNKTVLRVLVPVVLCMAALFLPVITAYAQDVPVKSDLKQFNPESLKPNKEVMIPDTNLKSYLHKKTGVAASDPILQSDLYTLNGTLDLKGKNILSAEGLQFCKNIEGLDLSNNKLSTLPNLSALTKLTAINLNNNRFTAIPGEVCVCPKLTSLFIDNNSVSALPADFPNLTALDTLSVANNQLKAFPSAFINNHIETLVLSGNPIASIPENLTGMTNLKNLYLSGCDLAKIPDIIFYVTGLRKLSLANNNIFEISKNIKKLSSLEFLDLSANKIEELPDEICSLSKLKSLIVRENRLLSLPSKIGNTKIEELNVNCNALNVLPASICESYALKSLDVRLNRLTKVPAHIEDINFSYVNFEWNFIDVSEGSSAGETFKAMKSSGPKLYLRQLKPISNPTAESQPDSITLFWDPSVDGSDNGSTWSVKKYYIYEINGDIPVQIMDLPPSQHSYTIPHLESSTIHSYKICGEYYVNDPSDAFYGGTKYYTQIEVKTSDLPPAMKAPALPESAASPASILTETFTPSPSPVPSVSEQKVELRDAYFPVFPIAGVLIMAIMLSIIFWKRRNEK